MSECYGKELNDKDDEKVFSVLNDINMCAIVCKKMVSEINIYLGVPDKNILSPELTPTTEKSCETKTLSSTTTALMKNLRQVFGNYKKIEEQLADASRMLFQQLDRY